MKKSRAVVTLLLTVVLTGLLLFTSAAGWGADGLGSADKIHLGLDLAGGVSITYQAVGDEAPSVEDMADTIYKLQKRVENYSTEAEVYQEGADRINIEIPGVTDANAILEELSWEVFELKDDAPDSIKIDEDYEDFLKKWKK